MDRDDVIALVRAIGGPDRADPVCPQGDMITLDVDEVVRLVNIAAAQQAEFAPSLMDPTKCREDQTQASEPVAWMSWTAQHGYGYWENHRDADLHSDPDYTPVALYAAPPAPAAPARLTDEDFGVFWLASTSDVDVSKSFAALALHYGRAVEAEVLRRMGVVG